MVEYFQCHPQRSFGGQPCLFQLLTAVIRPRHRARRPADSCGFSMGACAVRGRKRLRHGTASWPSGSGFREPRGVYGRDGGSYMGIGSSSMRNSSIDIPLADDRRIAIGCEQHGIRGIPCARFRPGSVAHALSERRFRKSTACRVERPAGRGIALLICGSGCGRRVASGLPVRCREVRGAGPSAGVPTPTQSPTRVHHALIRLPNRAKQMQRHLQEHSPIMLATSRIHC